MGALMVIFSLQPKQKAKTKGRLPLLCVLVSVTTRLHHQASTCNRQGAKSARNLPPFCERSGRDSAAASRVSPVGR